MREQLIREYFEVAQSITDDTDRDGIRLAETLFRRMTAAEHAEVKRLASAPCKGYGR